MKVIKLNRHKGIWIILAALLLPLGCTELANDSYNEIIVSEFEAGADDVTAIIGQAYVPWNAIVLQWNGLWRAQEITADQIVIPARPNGWVDGGIYRRLHEHRWTADNAVASTVWDRTYSAITTTNRVLYQIESGAIELPQEEQAAAIAEIRVLRAAYYYILLDLYGNVPIVDRFDVPEGFLPEQNTRQEVYDFVVNEITSNIDLLSEENNQTTYGKFNKWAAHTLLAKVYLNAEVYTGTPAWNQVIEHTNAVINSGAGYALEPVQKNVFVTENQNSSEIIFAIPIDEKYTDNWNAFDIHMQTLQPASQATYELLSGPWGGMCGIPQAINTYDTLDARYTDNWIMGQQYSSSGDSLFATLGEGAGLPLDYINEVPGVDESLGIHGVRLGKFEIAKGSSNILNNDYPLFRYADVLMMKAEALLRTGSADQAATIVTQIRERAFDNPGRAIVTGAELMGGSVYDYGRRDHNVTTQEGGDDIQYGRFLDELGWEFNQEGRRRQDLIRFGVFTEKSWFSHEPNGDYRVLFPIPTNELNTNPNLSQNPGY
ncbi:RagB/SusD family nutrient uptake outer membrane protein [Gracilimonas mengyeensis]|uniref:Starch-binding associating with outer membrane n=1 Tax=Gracilimonas mengyeensis TaxID=1302730 RepID=A0A521AZ51_9BACT|nr:RagB/SusD family nutrient uptake outer membrane protein [Gracilimonas mengyeensis]SMO39800.1 Starch-binding associating with outer membrane [Gracilimonas mengyeensis]